MNTALRKSRSGMSQTVILEGEASPQVLDELRVAWAILEDRFEAEVFLTAAKPTGPKLSDALPQIRLMAAGIAGRAPVAGGTWAAIYGPIDYSGRSGWGPGPIDHPGARRADFPREGELAATPGKDEDVVILVSKWAAGPESGSKETRPATESAPDKTGTVRI